MLASTVVAGLFMIFNWLWLLVLLLATSFAAILCFNEAKHKFCVSLAVQGFTKEQGKVAQVPEMDREVHFTYAMTMAMKSLFFALLLTVSIYFLAFII